jgi:serine/threonine-protein kinase
LVYDWLPGEIIYDIPDFLGQEGRRDPKSTRTRFCALPVEKIIAALNTIYDLHRVLAVAGFIAVDFYDGCILYDFEAETTYVIDLDEYRPGPFLNPMDRLFGSSRFMAPEEFQRGARIDQITNIFTMGRTALEFLADGNIHNWRGSTPAKIVVEKATQLDRTARYQSMADFVDAWESALDQG